MLLFTILIQLVGLNAISARLNEQIATAIVNDLDPNCVNETGLNVHFIASIAKNCIQDEFKTIKQQANSQNDVELWKILVCHDEVVQRCHKQLSNNVNPCLSNVSQDVLSEIYKMKEIAVGLLCADEGENIEAILDGNACSTTDCDVSGGEVQLKDFFSVDRCEIYKTFIQCKSSGPCPHLNHLYDITLKTMYQASPCAN